MIEMQIVQMYGIGLKCTDRPQIYIHLRPIGLYRTSPGQGSAIGREISETGPGEVW